MALHVCSQRFHPVEEVSTSEFSSVFRAIDTVGRHEVALKVAKSSSGPLGDALLKEFGFLSRCRHPHIIEVHDLGNDRTDAPFFAMEWINGCTLSSAGKEFGVPAVVNAIPALCQALAEVHDMGYVYGDLHPSNVLLGRRNGGLSATLIDFGLVSEIGTLNPKELWGTPEFIAPEISRGDPVGPASDVYSFGILLQKLLGVDASRVPAIPSHLLNPKTLQDLIGKCVEYYPESRPQDFHEIEENWSGTVAVSEEKRRRSIVVGKSQRRTFGQQAYLQRVEEYSERLHAEGGGVVLVNGTDGVGKSTLIDRYRRKLQTQGSPTLRIVCDNLREDSELILSAVRTWTENQDRAGRLPEEDAAGLYLFLEARDDIDIHSGRFDRLLSAVRKYKIICIIECASAAADVPKTGAMLLDLQPLPRTDFEELCVTLFKDVPMISALNAFLFSATGGLPGPLTEKYREFSAFLQQKNIKDHFNWRKVPRECAARWLGSLQRLPQDGWKIALAVSAVRTPFSIEDIAGVAGTDNKTSRIWVDHLFRAGFLKQVRVDRQIAYDTFSIWVDDTIRQLSAKATASRDPVCRQIVAQSTASAHNTKFRQFLLSPALLRSSRGLSAEYTDIRNLPFAVRACRQFYQSRPVWSELPVTIRRALFAAVIANYESLAAPARAGRWAWRLARLETRLMGAERPPTLTDVALPVRLLNRHCTARQKMEWIDGIFRNYPRLDDAITALLISEQGVVDLAQNDVENALRRFFEAEAIYNKNKARDYRRARNLNRIGIVYNYQKDYAKALKYYKLAHRELRTTPDPETYAVVSFNIGLVLYDLGRSREALAYMKPAHDYARKNHHLQILGFIARNMILCVADLEPAPAAVRAAEDALSASREAGDTSHDVIAHSNLGWAQLRAGNVQAAYANLMRGIDLARKTHDERWLSIVYLNLARLFHLQGDPGKEIAFALQSLRKARQQRSPAAIAEACRFISVLLSARGDGVRAVKFISRALRVYRPGENQRSDFFMDMAEARIRIQHGEFASAAGLLDRWSDGTRDLLPGWLCIHRRIRGLLDLSSGKPQGGINDLRDAGCRARALGRYDLLIPIYEDIVRAYTRSVNSRAAIPYAHELRRLYRKVGRMAHDDKLEAAIRELTEKSDDRRFAGMVLRLSESLTRFSDKLDLLEFLLGVAVEYFGADRGALISQHPASKRLFIEAHCGLKSGVDLDDTLEISRSVIKRVTRTSEFIKIDNAPEDPLTKTKKSILQHNIQAVMCVPIFHGGTIWGVLYLDNRSVPEAFKSTDSKMLQALANFMALAIEQSDEISRLRLRGPDTFTVGKGELQFVADSPKMRELLETVDRVADSDVTVLILGENGTGKDALAAYIHKHSGRKSQPFITMNCAGLVQSLADTELFGIEDKVATGVEFREGKFKLADGGTLFLNEIGDLPPSIQSKLLLALQDGIIERVGGMPMGVDVRFIAATNKNLEKMVEAGSFRKDLYYRINPLKVHIPALRERIADIPALARSFLNHYCRKYGRKHLEMDGQVLDELCSYSWPGNIRELKGMIQRGVLLAKDDRFPSGITTHTAQQTTIQPKKKLDLAEILKEKERECIIEALELDGYNQSKAANRLGLGESTLRTKMQKLEIKRPRRL